MYQEVFVLVAVNLGEASGDRDIDFSLNPNRLLSCRLRRHFRQYSIVSFDKQDETFPYSRDKHDSSLHRTSKTNRKPSRPNPSPSSHRGKIRSQKDGNLVIDTFQRNPPREVETAVSLMVQERNFFSRRRKKGNPIFSRKARDTSRGNYDQREIGCVE